MAVVIPYAQQTWTDGVSSCSAARNNVHEDGIRDAHFMPAVRVYHNANQSVANSTPDSVGVQLGTLRPGRQCRVDDARHVNE